jgi:D-glycero-D-manno-heptose 1,7-bisphosphate phosphatase
MAKRGKRAVFLDRDGTINVEKEYLFRVEEFEFIPGAPEAIKLLKDAGFLVVIVTNQSGIGRGFYAEADLERLHAFMEQALARIGTGVDAYYFCPHHPQHGQGEYRTECVCRKPLPGMLLAAARDLVIDLPASFMVGDKLADVEAGLAAGCRPVLVRTGYGAAEITAVPAGVQTVADLSAAAQLILAAGNEAESFDDATGGMLQKDD